MATTGKAILVAGWVLLIGLVGVYLEVRERCAGARIRQLLVRRDEALESVRRLQIEYNKLLSPDLLERSLPDRFQEEESDKEGGENDNAEDELFLTAR